MVIIIDNGPQFTKRALRDFCESQGIKLKSTIVYLPYNNDQVKEANKKILNLLKN